MRCRFRKCSVARDREKCFRAFYARVQRELGRASASASLLARNELKRHDVFFLSVFLLRTYRTRSFKLFSFFLPHIVHHHIYDIIYSPSRTLSVSGPISLLALRDLCLSLFPNFFPILSPTNFFPVKFFRFFAQRK